MPVIDKLAYSSVLRHKNIGMKVLFAIGTLVVCVGFRQLLLSLIIFIVMGVATLKYTAVKRKRYMVMLLWPMAFLIMGSLAIVLNITPEGIYVSKSSLIYGTSLMVVSMSSVSCLYFFILTTPLMDLMSFLERYHCPSLIIELMILIYRFIFVLLEIAFSITLAQNCRLGNRNIKTKILSMGKMLGQLLVIALHKVTLIFNSMEARCYDGKWLIPCQYEKPRKREKIGVTLFLVCLITIGGFGKAKGFI